MQQKCKPFVERLCDVLGEDLNSPICQELKEHLEGCPECSLQVDTVKRTVEIYRAIPGAKVPSEMEQRLLARLDLPPWQQPEE